MFLGPDRYANAGMRGWGVASLPDEDEMSFARAQDIVMNHLNDLDWAHLIDRRIKQKDKQI